MRHDSPGGAQENQRGPPREDSEAEILCDLKGTAACLCSKNNGEVSYCSVTY